MGRYEIVLPWGERIILGPLMGPPTDARALRFAQLCAQAAGRQTDADVGMKYAIPGVAVTS